MNSGVVAHTIIPALGRLRQDNHEFQTSLGYRVRPCLNKQTENSSSIWNRETKGSKKNESKKTKNVTLPGVFDHMQ
jgi:hypothetical protein